MTVEVRSVDDASEREQALPRRRYGAGVRYIPVAVLALFIVALQLHDGVHAVDLVRYALYWLIAVVLPGLVVSRSLIGVRATIVEDLAIGAVTGISLEVLAWVVGVTTGLGGIVRFWWVPVLIVGAAVPAVRRRVLVRVAERVPLPHSVVLVALVGYILALLNVSSFVFQARLPPRGGNTYVDMWWHLSLVQEMMKYQPPQIPQVAGMPFRYHFFANVQMASGARLSGVAPEVIVFRLWFVPVILISVGTAVALGRALTRSLTAGVATAGIIYGLSVASYIFPATLTSLAPTPLATTSPSQLLANIGLTTAGFGAVLLLRGRPSRWAVAWVVLIVLGASADKSTVIPLVFAGTVIALGRAVFTRSRVMVRWLGLATVAVLAVQAVIALMAAGTAGGKVTILGPLHYVPAFNGLVPSTELRATNHGLLLDSITSVKTAAYALLATVVVLVFHTVRLAGVVGLLRRGVRAHYAHWWLAGAVLAGYAAMLSIDHIGLSQVYFGMGAGVLGAALTVSVLWDAFGRLGAARWNVAIAGLVTGSVVTLLVDYVVAERKIYLGYGAMDRILIPFAVVAAVVLLGCLVWRWGRRRWTRDRAWALVLAALIGVALPETVTSVVTTAVRLVKPVAATNSSVIKPSEQRAALWLRSHSGTTDVVATNAYCATVVTSKNCSARGFWVSGLSGRRVVSEGWAYTTEVQDEQGVGGRTYDKQPSPFPERFKLNQAVFDDSNGTALAELKTKYHLRWLVSVHRAGPTPSFPASVAEKRFDNGAVTIFEVR